MNISNCFKGICFDIFCFALFENGLGVFAIISPDPDTHLLWKYMIFILLGISAIQVLLGIIVSIISKKKK